MDKGRDVSGGGAGGATRLVAQVQRLTRHERGHGQNEKLNVLFALAPVLGVVGVVRGLGPEYLGAPRVELERPANLCKSDHARQSVLTLPTKSWPTRMLTLSVLDDSLLRVNHETSILWLEAASLRLNGDGGGQLGATSRLTCELAGVEAAPSLARLRRAPGEAHPSRTTAPDQPKGKRLVKPETDLLTSATAAKP